ncbi:MAG: SMC-Scp complex subunit ScpB [Patescibacteria group bacterium]
MPTDLKSKIESLLFIAGKPLAPKEMVKLAGGKISAKEVNTAVDELIKDYQNQERGVRIIKSASEVQMVTSGDNAPVIQNFIKAETTGELTKPSIEALTIVAYRGPITKWELERIRGVNCSLILRNLMLRGLVEEKVDSKRKETHYTVTLDFLKYLGISDVRQLPDYESLRHNENIEKFLRGES